MVKVKTFLCACLCILAVLATAARSDDIEVRNPRRDQSITLSDFIVYGEDPNKQKKVIRAPDDPNDDTVIPGWGTRRFTAEFEIKKYIISSAYIDDEGHYVEHEIVVFEVEKIVPKKLAYIDIRPYLMEQLKAILEIDQAVAPEPPPVGTILAFVGGLNPQMPGWFVGTDINFDTGEVTGAYTGNVEVLSTAFEVMVFTPPYPPDGAVDIPLNADLHWPESEEAVLYDVYFGTNFDDVKYGRIGTFKSSQSSRTYDPGTLEPCYYYYWKIEPVIEEEPPDEEPPDEEPPDEPKPPPDEPKPLPDWPWLPDPNEPKPLPDWPLPPDPNEPKPLPDWPWLPVPNEPPIIVESAITTSGVRIYADMYSSGEAVLGPIWSFMTGPAKATNPYPVDGAIHVDPNAILSWTPGCLAASDDVYFGTDFYAVANADTSDTTGIYRARLDANDYNPGTLEPGTVYYWKIYGVNEVPPDSPWSNGNIWSFTTVKAGESGTTLFSDDFESYTLGTFPSADWEIVWAGTGENYVTNAYSFSPTKSLQLWGRASWSSVAQRKFSTDATVIGYECAICIDSIGTGGPGREEAVGFFNRDVYIWGRGYAVVLFNHDDGEIKAEDGTVLGDWEPGVWYHVKVVLDRRTNTYSTWIDGQFKGDGLFTTHSDTELIDALSLMSDHAGVKVYYDDVKVWEVDARRASNPSPADGTIGISSEPLLSTYISDDVPLNIPDRGRVETTVFSSLAIPGSLTIIDLNVLLDITMPVNNAGLNVFLIGPDGTRVELFTDVGLTSKNDFTNTILDDEASISVRDGRGSFTGTYKPEGKLSDFDGKNAQGTWKLEITGDWANNVGTLNSWQLVIESPNIISWVPGNGIASQDVYFSNNFNEVNNSAEAAYQGNFAADVSTIEVVLDPDQTYFWRIDSLDADGMLIVTGDVWSLSTMSGGPVPIPYPNIGEVDVPLDVILSWGFSPDEDDELDYPVWYVYFGDDFDAVANADTSDTTGIYRARLDANSYNPGTLEPGTVYYWKIYGVNEVPPDSPWSNGNIWSFTTADYLFVDDFESYNNLPPDDPNSNRIFETWKDGWGYLVPPNLYDIGNLTGSRVDIDPATVHEGTQSMKFDYDNTGTFRNIFGLPVNACYSETERTFDAPQDWARGGVKALSLWFYGDPNNDAEPMYVAVEDNMGMSAAVYHDNLDAARIGTWQQWNINLQEFAGVNPASIRKMCVGVGDRNKPTPGGTGTVYFDNITLRTDP